MELAIHVVMARHRLRLLLRASLYNASVFRISLHHAVAYGHIGRSNPL